MTQTTLEVAPMAPETSSSTSRRPLFLLLGGVAAVAVLGGGGYMLTSGGSSDGGSGPLPVHHLGLRTSGTHAVPAVKKPSVAIVPAVSTVPIGRDPFLALYVPHPDAGAGTVATGSTTPPTTTTTTTVPTTTTTTTGTVTPAKPTVYKLSLTKVSGSGKDLTATFSVAGRMMVAKAGSVFGPTSELKLLSIGQNAKGAWVATIQVGDDDPIDVRMGDVVYVR